MTLGKIAALRRWPAPPTAVAGVAALPAAAAQHCIIFDFAQRGNIRASLAFVTITTSMSPPGFFGDAKAVHCDEHLVGSRY
jgi:hypothetical protein